jgi:hypothetical protein
LFETKGDHVAGSAVSALLKKTATRAETKKKSTVPVITDFTELADEVSKRKQVLKDAEALYGVAESMLEKHARDLYVAAAESGDFTKSLTFQGGETPGVMVTYQDKFSALPGESEETLKKSLTKADFDMYFEERRQLSLSRTDDATIGLLVEKLGEEVFASIFDVKLTLVPKGDMDRNQFSLPPKVRAMLKQAKASVKLVSEDK